MVSTYTTNKSLEKPGNGDYVDTWNVPVNSDMDVIDQAFGGLTSLNATSGSATLTSTQYRSLIIGVSGAMSASVTYTIPSGVGGQWIIYNTTTDSTGGPWTVTFNSGGGGTTVSVSRNTPATIYSDGTNIRTFTYIPSGVITMWSGSIASIPSGWYLCNGSNGTPDLRDRFIVGAGSTYAVAATGGSADATLVAHSHSASSTVSDPGHAHTQQGETRLFGSDGLSWSGGPFTVGQVNTYAATTGITVSTTISSAGSSGTNANLPPYYALAYIMKA